MSLLQVQRLLAQLYTNDELRKRFFHDPQSTGQEWGLSEPEIEQLSALPAFHTEHFAHSLVHKRQGQVQKLLGRSFQVMGAEFNKAFHRFAKESVPTGIRKHKEDAIAFARFLDQEWLTPGAGQPEWLSELVAYEAAWIEAHHPDLRWQWRSFRFPIRELSQSLARGDIPRDLKPRRTLALWWRWRPQKALQHRLFDSFASLLAALKTDG